MRILYGVQTTGHGHLVRSTPIIRELRGRGHVVDVVLSGPPPDPLWLDRIGSPLTTHPGLTFSAETLLGESVDFRATETGVSIDGANIVLESVDIPAANCLIHVIDAVLLPAQQSIGELVVASASGETPQFTVLLAAVEALGLTETVLDPESDLTVFAPTDAAFAAAFEALGVTAEDVLADTELLAAIDQIRWEQRDPAQ